MTLAVTGMEELISTAGKIKSALIGVWLPVRVFSYGDGGGRIFVRQHMRPADHSNK
jgi:hypothetical protein